MARHEPARKSTYRIPISATLTTTCGIEIHNPTASGVLIALRRFQVHVSSAMNLTLTRRDAPATGGTAVSVTPVPAIHGEPPAQALVRYFTAPPTLGGNLLDTPLTLQIPAAALASDTLDAEDLVPLALRPGQIFCFDTGAIVLRGTLLFTEEPWP
ncbi:MAG: hypothetical protein RMJ43_03930 [Chloroherpetonaceae bacterium]|nr:hypothetical protein [Chloroherpetonaceae bacterium]